MRLLLRILSKYIFRHIYTIYVFPIKKIRSRTSGQKSSIKIESTHLLNSKLIPDRNELLKLFPKGGIVAELGVDEGCFSEEIINICDPQKLHLVDFWGSNRYDKKKENIVNHKFREQIVRKQIEINKGLSVQVASQFQDRYFDWIYIDTDHSYEATKQELEAYSPKIKENGIIAGHDFIGGDWNSLIRYGVREAVYEFCVNFNWEILYLTCETDIPPSFAILRKKNF